MADSEKVSSLPSVAELAANACAMPWEDKAPFSVRYEFKEAVTPELFTELLEALQEMLAVNADPAPGWSPDLLLDIAAFRQFLDGCDTRKKAAKDKARAAIQKATGEQQ